jgi:hypothetical protein
MAAVIPISTGRLTHLFLLFESWQIDYFIREEGVALRAFGYDPVSQNFPKARPAHSSWPWCHNHALGCKPTLSGTNLTGLPMALSTLVLSRRS